MNPRALTPALNPLLPFTLCFVAGIAVCECGGGVYVPLAAAAAAVALLLSRRRGATLLPLAFLSGWAVAALAAPVAPGSEMTAGPHRWSGVVTEMRRADGLSVMVVTIDSMDTRPCTGVKAKIAVPSLLGEVEERDRIAFTARLRLLSRSVEIPDEVDFNAPLARAGVTVESLVSPTDIHSSLPEPGMLNSLRRSASDVARAIAADGSLTPGAAGFLIAVLTADRSLLTPSDRALFSSTGLAHLLALSGLHVGIIALMLSALLFPLRLVRGGRRWTLYLTVTALWGFAIMTGLSPSVTRAVIMATLMAAAALTEREWSPLNALCAAAVLILLFTPSALFTLGFQLSFLAVASLLLLADRLNPFPRSRPGLRSLGAMCAVPLAAMLGTGIVSAIHFHSFPVWFILANVPAALIITPLLGAGALKAALSLAGFYPAWLPAVINRLHAMLLGIARGVESMPFTVMDGVYVTPLMAVGWFAALGLFTAWLYRRRTSLLIASGMAALFTVALPAVNRPALPRCELHISSTHSATTLLVREEGTLYALTSSRSPSEVMGRDSVRLRRFMLRRGVSVFTEMPDSLHTPAIHRRGDCLAAGGKVYAMVNSPRPAVPAGLRAHYAVVCAGFKGDILKLASSLRADSLLLGADINLRRHDRYVRELSEAGIPHRSLRR